MLGKAAEDDVEEKSVPRTFAALSETR